MAVPTTYKRYVYSGSAVFAYGDIDLISALNLTHAEQLVVSLNGTTLTNVTDYTIDEGTEEVTVSATLATGDVVVIERSTKNDAAYVDFENNTAIDADDLDANNQQLLFLIQELLSQSEDSVTLDLTGDCWDAENKRICNVADGTANTDAVNLRQLLSAVEGAETATVDNVGFFSFTGDGVETAFTLTGAGVGFSDDEEILTFVGGVIQKPGTDFSVSAGDTANPIVTFTTAPPNGVAIYCFTISGVVRAVLNTEIVDGASITDGTLSLDAINFGAGVAKRFIVVDAAGAYALRVAVASDISDLATVVKAYRLDEFAAPTANISMNSNKITSLSTGTSAADAVNKAQMDAAIAAAVGVVDVGGVTNTGQISANLQTSPVTGTNSGSQTRFYYAEVTAGGNNMTIEVKTSSGAYVEVAKLTNTSETHTMTFVVPPSGGYRISGSTGALVRLTYQEIA